MSFPRSVVDYGTEGLQKVSHLGLGTIAGVHSANADELRIKAATDVNPWPTDNFMLVVRRTGEQIFVSERDGNILKRCIRGAGGTRAGLLSSGEEVQVVHSADAINKASAEIVAIERFLGADGSTVSWERDLHAHLGGIINVRAPPYNARGDGQADDTSAFQAAIDSRPDRSAAVFIPPGRYRLTRSLTLGNSTKLLGAGSLMTTQGDLTYRPQSVLDFSSADLDGIVTPRAEPVSYRAHGIVIRSLTVKGSGRANGKSGIKFQTNEASLASLKKVGLSKVIDTYVEDFEIGIDLHDEADSCWILDSHVHACRVGIRDGSTESRIVGNSLWDIDGPGAIVSRVSQAYIYGNEIEPGKAPGLVLRGRDNSIYGNNFKETTVAAIIEGERNAFVGNTIVRTDDGIVVGSRDGSSAGSYNTLVGNVLSGFGRGTAAAMAGVSILGASRNNVVIANTFSSPGPNAAHAIRVAAVGNNVPTSTRLIANQAIGAYHGPAIANESDQEAYDKANVPATEQSGTLDLSENGAAVIAHSYGHVRLVVLLEVMEGPRDARSYRTSPDLRYTVEPNRIRITNTGNAVSCRYTIFQP